MPGLNGSLALGKFVKVTGLVEIRKALSDLRDYGSQELFQEVGFEAKSMIQRRTLRGQDINGRAFKPYSRGYRKTGTPDLHVTGSMLGAISHESNNKQTRVFVENTGRPQKIGNYDLAMVHNEGGKSGRGSGFMMPKREFFGITLGNEVDKIREVFRRYIYALVDRLNK